jgi:hypothetical protein
MRCELIAVPFMMVVDMRDPEAIWRFGRWLAQRRDGVVRLSGSSGGLLLRLTRGRIVSVEGPDPGLIARRLGVRPAGNGELVAEAVALAGAPGPAQTQAIGAVKELVQQSLAAWFVDPERRLAIVDSEVASGESPTISAAHAVVELVLASQDPAVTRAILPDLELRLRRSADLLELYSPLRLSEEADLIVAKVNGQRTASEIAGRSPHGHDEVLNLLAALVAAGMLEPVPAAEATTEEEAAAAEKPAEQRIVRRRLPAWVLVAALAAVLTIAVIIAVVWQRAGGGAGNPGAGPGWGLVVDMGCEPQELQRVYRKARQYPDALRALETAGAEGSPCWRLVWGNFPSREAASRAIADIPPHLKLEGFTPHAVELPPKSKVDALAGEGG